MKLVLEFDNAEDLKTIAYMYQIIGLNVSHDGGLDGEDGDAILDAYEYWYDRLRDRIGREVDTDGIGVYHISGAYISDLRNVEKIEEWYKKVRGKTRDNETNG